MINPFSAVDKFPEIEKPRYKPPIEDFWKIYDIAEGQDKVMLLTFLLAGARRNEIFNLKWEEIDWQNSLIRLWTNKRGKGNREYDWIPMTQELKKVLLEWWEVRPVKTTEYVFVCLDGHALNQDNYGKPFTVRQHFMKRLCKKAGVKSFGFHGIRHLTATELYRKGYKNSLISSLY